MLWRAMLACAVQVGDSVAPGDMLCEVETDKATIAWEAQEEGFIAAILLPGGSKDVAVGTPAAVIVEEEVRFLAVGHFGRDNQCRCELVEED